MMVVAGITEFLYLSLLSLVHTFPFIVWVGSSSDRLFLACTSWNLSSTVFFFHSTVFLFLFGGPPQCESSSSM
jgi:uncharacterized membrane protein